MFYFSSGTITDIILFFNSHSGQRVLGLGEGEFVLYMVLLLCLWKICEKGGALGCGSHGFWIVGRYSQS